MSVLMKEERIKPKYMNLNASNSGMGMKRL